MMVLKIVSYASSVVSLNKKDCVQILGRVARLKVSNIYHQPAFQAAPPTCPQQVWRGGRGQRRVIALKAMSPIFLEKPLQTAVWQIQCSQLQKERVGTGKTGKKYRLDIVGASSTTICSSGIVDLDDA